MIPQPQSIVTLLVADNADTKLYVTETTAEIAALIKDAKDNGDLVGLQRVRGMEAVEFMTQPTNIINVEANV